MQKLKGREFANAEADLRTLVDIGYIYDALGISASDAACTLLGKGLKQINQDVPLNLYYLAEAKRLFKCKSLDKLDTTITSVLKDSKALTDATDLYHAFKLNKNAAKYGFKPSAEFTKSLTGKGVEDILGKFKAEDWTYNGQPFSVDSLRIVELFASLNNTKAEAQVKTAMGKLIAQAFEDDKTFFIITKNANSIDNSEINLYILDLLISSNKVLSELSVKGEQLVKYRNYFL